MTTLKKPAESHCAGSGVEVEDDASGLLAKHRMPERSEEEAGDLATHVAHDGAAWAVRGAMIASLGVLMLSVAALLE